MPGRPVSADEGEWLFHPIETRLAAHHLLFMRTLDGLHRGEYRNCMIFAPPGSAKSSYGSVVFPAYVMGQQPMARVIMTSYASDIARKQSRRTRQIVRSAGFRPIFNAGLVGGNEAVDAWALDNGSEYMAGGILAGVTGNRATHLLIDDPISGREDADSPTIRKKTREAYEDDLTTRLMPGAKTLIVQCMTGDTKVLMADGAEKMLLYVRPGDAIATYKDGELSASKVTNWANQGTDRIYAISTTSGTIVKANERHPFLVESDGVQEWKRLRDLKVGDLLVRAQFALTKDAEEKSRASSFAQSTTTLTGLRVEEKPQQSCRQASALTERGRASNVLMKDATSLQSAKDSAHLTTTKTSGQAGTGRHQSTQETEGLPICGTAMESTLMNTRRCLKSRAGDAPSAINCPAKTCGHIGAESCASITATTQGKCADCSAMIATSLLDTGRLKMSCSAPLHTYEIALDPIESIAEAGREDVFDIEVAETENFIANGLVSHNTRWHQDDLAGGLLPKGWDGESGLMRGQDGQDWMVVSLPAIADRPDDPLGRKIGEPLWPEWFSGDHFERYRSNARTWSSLFQQKPTPDDGDYFRREMFRWFENRPKQLRIYGASDFAVTDGGGDYTVHGVFGVDPTGAIYVLDWWRGQTSPDIWIDELLSMADRWQTVKWFGEAGPIRRSIEPYLRKRMQERGKYISLEWLASVSDKPTRARSIQGRIAQGMVYFPSGKPWAQDVLSQCLRFPNTDDDDDVDVLSLIGRGIDGMMNAKPEAQKRKPAPQPGSIEWVLQNSKEEKQASPYR